MSESSPSKIPEPPYPLGGATSLLFEILLAIGFERLVNSYFPSLQPYVWLCIVSGLTWKSLNARPLRKLFILAYSRWGVRNRVLSYTLIAVAGAAVFTFYWWGVSRTFAALEQYKEAQRISTPAPTPEFVQYPSPPTVAPSIQAASPAPSNAPPASKGTKAAETRRRREQLLRDLHDPRNP